MKKKDLISSEQQETAVIWLLAIVDNMIALHKSDHPLCHRGLCSLRDKAFFNIVWNRPIMYGKRRTIEYSLERLIIKHLKPARARTYWFGFPNTQSAYKRRTAALNKLRAIIAAGDINPY